MANTYTQIYIKTDEERGSVNVPPRTGLELFLVLVSTKMALLTELGAVKEYGRMRNEDRLLSVDSGIGGFDGRIRLVTAATWSGSVSLYSTSPVDCR